MFSSRGKTGVTFVIQVFTYRLIQALVIKGSYTRTNPRGILRGILYSRMLQNDLALAASFSQELLTILIFFFLR